MSKLPVIDFARPADASRRRWRWVVAAFGIALGAEVGWFGWSMQQQQSELHHLALAQAELRERLALPVARVIDPRRGEHVVAAQEMVRQLGIPWESLLVALEAARGGKVVVASIVPDSKERTVEIAAHAHSFPEIAAFVDRLAANPVFQRVSLRSQAASSVPGGPTGFVVVASWSGER